eukprot:3398704-Rhodomonas_salina.2
MLSRNLVPGQEFGIPAHASSTKKQAFVIVISLVLHRPIIQSRAEPPTYLFYAALGRAAVPKSEIGSMSNDNGVAPIGSSADVGWVDGKPRAPVSEEAKKFLMGGGTRVTESQLAGRMPRPRSKNVPQPASLVNYNEASIQPRANLLLVLSLLLQLKFVVTPL